MNTQLKPWPDREKWASASVVPPGMIIAVHSGLFLVSLSHGSLTSAALFGLFVLMGIYSLLIIHKARKQLEREAEHD